MTPTEESHGNPHPTTTIHIRAWRRGSRRSAARAQQLTHIPWIGFPGLGPASASASRVEALRAGLRDLGYVEGKNIVIEFRWADKVDQQAFLRGEPEREWP